MKDKRIQLGMLLTIVMVIFMAGLGSASFAMESNSVLYINSYHEGYKWSDDVQLGIESVLYEIDRDINLDVEYLDLKRIEDQEAYLESLEESFDKKYSNRDYDLILLSDDYAVNFYMKIGNQVFGKTPVVFCGLNNPEIEFKDHMTGFVESLDVIPTIDLIIKLHPNVENIYYVTDNTVTGNINEWKLLEIADEYKSYLSFEKLSGPSLGSIADEAGTLPEDSVILFLTYFYDESGKYFDHDEALPIIASKSKVPIYSTWDFNLGNGVVGGKMLSGFEHGKYAAQVGEAILNGTDISQFSIVSDDSGIYMFDGAELERFDISLDLLPEDSVIINQRKQDKNYVLVVNSYDTEFKWTSGIVDGIRRAFSKDDLEVEFQVEYLDYKRITDAVLRASIEETIVKKYEKNLPDIIITSDDLALNFILSNKSHTFRGIPVVFCGLNNYTNPEISKYTDVTGVIEAYDLKGTLDGALKINPDYKKVFVINDQTVTGKANTVNVQKLESDYEDRLTFEYLEPSNMHELQKVVSNLSSDTFVLLMTFNRDVANQVYTYEESIRAIEPHSNVPLFGVWDFYLGSGIVGGMVTDGQGQGQLAGEMAIKILKGVVPSELPIVTEAQNTYKFDYDMLKKHGIESSALPNGSKIINRPVGIADLYRDYRPIFIVTVFVLSALLVSLLWMAINLRYRRKSQEEIEKVAAVDKLTGTYNRWKGIEMFSEVLEAMKRHGDPLTLAFVDINGLKKVNDTYGHLEGDELIIKMCEVIFEHIRGRDIFCRFGGDEFIVVFPECDIQNAKFIFERIEKGIDELNSGDKPYVYSLSVGYSALDHMNDMDVDDLIERADQAMYMDKQMKKKVLSELEEK